ncbi:hypothetical protein [Pantoea sp. ME81]|uniref:hypothetical protein n=1 Tax=Pantoea sp. ME81 TaxID=2743935 RepID=UPI0015F6E602|nr:hypothetical protein [Pantoea sp. ME81]
MSKEITLSEQLYTNKDHTGLFRIQGEAIQHEAPQTTIIVYQDLNDKGSSLQYTTKEDFYNNFKEVSDDAI